MKRADDHTHICPICHQYKFDDDYDICHVCFWENDPFQYDNIERDGGSNNLSIVDYRKWWQALNILLPSMIDKYNITRSKLSKWMFGELVVPRENIKSFIDDLTKHNIEVRCSFYNVCDRYHYDSMTFHGFPRILNETVKDNNVEALSLIFAKNPLRICEKYDLVQVKEILEQAQDKQKMWEELTPNISISPNPTELPNL